MADAPLEAVVAAFNTADGASNALKQLKEAPSDVLKVREAAVLTHDAEGKLQIKEMHHVGKGAAIGGVTGAVIGLVAGPVGWLTVGGAAVGGLAARLRDSGFPDDRLKEIGDSLKPGTSALIAIVEHTWVLEVERLLREAGAEYATEAVKAEIAAQLDEQASKEAAATGASTGSRPA